MCLLKYKIWAKHYDLEFSIEQKYFILFFFHALDIIIGMCIYTKVQNSMRTKSNSEKNQLLCRIQTEI